MKRMSTPEAIAAVALLAIFAFAIWFHAIAVNVEHSSSNRARSMVTLR
ncbi:MULTISPECIES: hypothetical protein [Bradyrhizobium]|jgi:hypothetical protein|uniref:Uncharacterized protein n=1 Tax=Bradyrhizobium elkanii TaxID=29448 RepID=A0ABV4EQL8_BRAEL|nr:MULTISPECIES: hypothetical protein [Bradyrhizobium]MCA1398974.1 hypothetical protein [Bradyrhizobium sp. BRP56]MCP1758595.1 hypothetical protein [Bradyrhizobium elkanii]MCP1975909.1 hypothetical protein [Bradyrhizobium elkanii]MCP1984789.1 hypothetical protein [Bradyrhizobium elkanii]MCS3695153.1 hypothetical protein [Bradyrhizobium elkanii]